MKKKIMQNYLSIANNNNMHAVKYKINILSYFWSHKILQNIWLT